MKSLDINLEAQDVPLEEQIAELELHTRHLWWTERHTCGELSAALRRRALASSAALATLRATQEAAAACDVAAAYRSARAALLDATGPRCQCSHCQASWRSAHEAALADQPLAVTASERGLFW